MPELPQKYQGLAIAQIVAGLVNLFVGWVFSSMLLSFVGGTCTGILTFGICPIGLACGILSWLIIPIGVAETVFGVLMLVSPDTVKGLVGWLPFAQLPLILLGDFVSPVVGLVGLMLTRDPEVAGYIEGL